MFFYHQIIIILVNNDSPAYSYEYFNSMSSLFKVKVTVNYPS